MSAEDVVSRLLGAFRGLREQDEAMRLLAVERLQAQFASALAEDPLALAGVLPTAARLAQECPFEDVRATLEAELERLAADPQLAAHVPAAPSSASRFFACDKALLVRDEQRGAEPLAGSWDGSGDMSEADGVFVTSPQKVMERVFAESGRLSNLHAVLASHPRYLACHHDSWRSLMLGEGPLPVPWRFFVAMMAAGRHRCEYLIRDAMDHFLDAGGPIDWLDGLSSPTLPERLRALGKLNAVLAHRPWELRADDIGDLTHGENPWAINQLVHATLILVTYHALASAVLGAGVEPELDFVTGWLGAVGVEEPLPADPAADSAATTADTGARGGGVGGGGGGAGGAGGSGGGSGSGGSRESAVTTTTTAAAATVTDAKLAASGDTKAAGDATPASSATDPCDHTMRSRLLEGFGALAGVHDGSGDAAKNDTDTGLRETKEAGGGAGGAVGGAGGGGAGDRRRLDSGKSDAPARPGSRESTRSRTGSGRLRGTRVPLPGGIRPMGPFSDDDDDEEEEDEEVVEPDEELAQEGEGVSSRRGRGGSTPTVTSSAVAVSASSSSEAASAAATVAASSEALEGSAGAGAGAGEDDLMTSFFLAFAGPTAPGSTYVNFDTKFGVLRQHDFSWEGGGFSLVSRFAPAVGLLLERQFRVAFSLTYFSYGAEAGYDTREFREAVWYYVARLYGVVNDEYPYPLVNQRVTRNVKAFARQVVCFPERVRRADFDAMSATMTDSERVHVVFLCVEARKQAGLLHALRAIARHLK